MGFGEMGFGEVGFGEVGFGEMGFGEVGFGVVGFGVVGFGEVGFGEMGFGEVGFGEVGFGEMGFGEMDGNHIVHLWCHMKCGVDRVELVELRCHRVCSVESTLSSLYCHRVFDSIVYVVQNSSSFDFLQLCFIPLLLTAMECMGKGCNILVHEDFVLSLLTNSSLRDKYQEYTFSDHVKVG